MGCAECNQTGYRGRIGLYELLVMNESLREVIRSTAQLGQFRAHARALGMRSMREDGLDKVIQGLTTLEEILRVVPRVDESGIVCGACGQTLVREFSFCPKCGKRATEQSTEVKSPPPAQLGEVVQ